MEAEWTSETLVFCSCITRRHTPEDFDFYSIYLVVDSGESESCPCAYYVARHEDVWWNRDIAPCILNLGTR